MSKSLTGPDLRELGRALPDQILIRPEGRDGHLIVSACSRHLPGRRLAGVGIWQGVPVFIKLFFGRRRIALLGVSRAMQEFQRELRMSEALAKGRVSAPELLDHGSLEGGGFWLVQELLPDLQNFKECWLTAKDSEEKLHYFAELIEVLRQLYAANLYQADAHQENFAYSNGRLYVLDAGGVKKAEMAVQSKLLRNLALIVAQFPYPLHGDLIELCCQKLCLTLTLTEASLTGAVRDAWRQRMRKLTYKMLRTSSWVSKIKGHNLKALCMRRTQTAELRRALASCAALDEAIERGRILKDGNSATVAEIILGGQVYVIKRYNLKSHWVSVKRAFGRSRAHTSWLGGHILNLMSVPTSVPVAMVEERRWGILRRAYFISTLTPGDDAYHYLPAVGCQGDLLRNFESVFYGLIYTQVSHGDMKATNFLVDGDRVAIIDLDAVRIHSSELRFKQAIRKDFDRFLQNWRPDGGLHKQFTQVIQGLLKR